MANITFSKAHKEKQSRKRMLTWLAIGLSALILIIAVVRIIDKYIENSKKIAPLAYSVNSIYLKKIPITMTVSGEGIMEGDPQILAYPDVPGKFQYNTVKEGSYVAYNQAISYLDRDIVGETYNLAPVRSPISGIVIKLYYIDRGALVSVNSPVAEVADTNKVLVDVTLGVDDLLKVKKGMLANVLYESATNIRMKMTVDEVTPFVESQTLSGTVTLKAPLTNSDMKIGMSVKADIIIGVTNAFAVPEESVIANLDIIYIFVNDHGRARQVNITRGYSYGGMVQISGDLNDGDEVITSGAFKLNDGDLIKTYPTNLNYMANTNMNNTNLNNTIMTNAKKYFKPAKVSN